MPNIIGIIDQELKVILGLPMTPERFKVIHIWLITRRNLRGGIQLVKYIEVD